MMKRSGPDLLRRASTIAYLTVSNILMLPMTLSFQYYLALLAAIRFYPAGSRHCSESGCPAACDNFQIGDGCPITNLSVHNEFLQDVPSALTFALEVAPLGVMAHRTGVAPCDFRRLYILFLFCTYDRQHDFCLHVQPRSLVWQIVDQSTSRDAVFFCYHECLKVLYLRCLKNAYPAIGEAAYHLLGNACRDYLDGLRHTGPSLALTFPRADGTAGGCEWRAARRVAWLPGSTAPTSISGAFGE